MLPNLSCLGMRFRLLCRYASINLKHEHPSGKPGHFFHMVKSLPLGRPNLQKYAPPGKNLGQKPHPQGNVFTFFNTVIVILEKEKDFNQCLYTFLKV